MNIVVSDPYKESQILELINSFEEKGDTFYAKRNTIKIFSLADEVWNVKSFKVPHLVNRFAYKFLRKSKAQRSFEYANYLLKNGILTPRPIAYAEQFNAFGLLKSFYVSENLDYDLTFRELIHDVSYPDRKNILEQFTAFTYKLHQKGIYFLDHSPGNTLIIKKEKGQYDFYLIDLNRMEFKELDLETRIQNFANLTLTPDMISIMSAKYADLMQIDPQIIHQKISKVAKISADKRLRKHKLKQKMGRK